jgi:large conductance mechanosensitive channel
VLKDFKAFILRGNVVDLAVGIVIGAAFTAVITSFVTNVLTPLVSIPGKTNFKNLTFTVGGGHFSYGLFLNSLVSFLLVASAVFFVVVRPLNALMARRRAGQEVEPGTRDCPQCLSEIPTAARRCSFCTSEVVPTAPAGV